MSTNTFTGFTPPTPPTGVPAPVPPKAQQRGCGEAIACIGPLVAALKLVSRASESPVDGAMPEMCQRQTSDTTFAAAYEQIRQNRRLLFLFLLECGRCTLQGSGRYFVPEMSSALRGDKQIVLMAVHQQGEDLQCASAAMRNNKEVVLTAVRQVGHALQFASTELRNDKEVVMAAILESGWALQYASATLRDDNDLVLAAVLQDGRALICASAKMRNNKAMVMAAVLQDVRAILCASATLRMNSEEILMIAEHARYQNWEFQRSASLQPNVEPAAAPSLAAAIVDKIAASAANGFYPLIPATCAPGVALVNTPSAAAAGAETSISRAATHVVDKSSISRAVDLPDVAIDNNGVAFAAKKRKAAVGGNVRVKKSRKCHRVLHNV